MNTKNKKKLLLENLYAQYQNCTACPLGFQDRKNIVFGYGNSNALIMFIGEGPGKDEDEQGKPFVGRSGKLLTKILEPVGIKREDVFITNVVKCRPPQNRKPLSVESKTCKNLLLFKQINIIKPKIICTLGASALEALIEQPIKISQIRGTIIHHKTLTILPTYHPAYLLRNRKEIEKFISDMKKLKKLSL